MVIEVRYFLISIDTLRGDTAEDCNYPKLFDFWSSKYYTSCNWTLPAHAALLTGNSLEHGCHWDWAYPETTEDTNKVCALKNNALKGETIAEKLSELKVPCAAIVGGGFVSDWFGFRRGFNWWTQEISNPLHYENGELLENLQDDTFYFIHDWYVHNYFDDAGWDMRVMRENHFLDYKRMTAKSLFQGRNAYYKRAVETRNKLDDLINLYPNDAMVVVSDHGESFFEDNQNIHHGVYAELKQDSVARCAFGIRNINFKHNGDLFDTDVKNILIHGSVPADRRLRGRYSFRGNQYAYSRMDGKWTQTQLN